MSDSDDDWMPTKAKTSKLAKKANKTKAKKKEDEPPHPLLSGDDDDPPSHPTVATPDPPLASNPPQNLGCPPSPTFPAASQPSQSPTAASTPLDHGLTAIVEKETVILHGEEEEEEEEDDSDSEGENEAPPPPPSRSKRKATSPPAKKSPLASTKRRAKELPIVKEPTVAQEAKSTRIPPPLPAPVVVAPKAKATPTWKAPRRVGDVSPALAGTPGGGGGSRGPRLGLQRNAVIRSPLHPNLKLA